MTVKPKQSEALEQAESNADDVFAYRRAGCLLHPTSLPVTAHSLNSGGTLGDTAHHFLNFLSDCGISIWQMLPLGPTHASRSPYQCVSTYAGNPAMICLDELDHRSWLAGTLRSARNDGQISDEYADALQLAATVFFEAVVNGTAFEKDHQAFKDFLEKQFWWLEDYAWFQVLRKEFDYLSWSDWPSEFRSHDRSHLKKARKEFTDRLQYYYFEQFIFFLQWEKVRKKARKKNILLFGDIPIFVAYESADVWANQTSFNLDKKGKMKAVAGVPPDYFSETGQHWGNPHYDWADMQKNDFTWWKQRVQMHLDMFDLIRIDHFRGLDAYWEIPGNSKDARTGRWKKAPGEALLQALFTEFRGLPIVAENLGLITESVEDLRKQFDLPGMAVLQFAFDNNPANPHLPHNHEVLSVAYTGTHDNDTTLGWYDTLNATDKSDIADYCFHAQGALSTVMNKICLASVARFAILPLQDMLGLDASHRMNTPGTAEGNWGWSFHWDMVPEELAADMKRRVRRYGRIFPPELPETPEQI